MIRAVGKPSAIASAWPAISPPPLTGQKKCETPAPLAPQVADDLQAADAVAGDHVRVVVGRRLDGPLLLGDLAGQAVALAGLVVAGDVVGADLRAERPRQLELHPRRGLGHDDDHPLAETASRRRRSPRRSSPTNGPRPAGRRCRSRLFAIQFRPPRSLNEPDGVQP